MLHLRLALIVLATTAVTACGTRAKVEPSYSAKLYAPNNGQVCLLAGALPSDDRYEVLGRIKATKRTYGSTDELFPLMARKARKLGADAIINLQADQRFKGPLPWRVTSPTGDGSAVKIVSETPRFDCAMSGGRLI
jgi:hypothetical protein